MGDSDQFGFAAQHVDQIISVSLCALCPVTFLWNLNVSAEATARILFNVFFTDINGPIFFALKSSAME